MTASTSQFSVLLPLVVAFACTVEEGPRQLEYVEELREGGCGAGRKPGTATQTCTYVATLNPNAAYSLDATGKCISDDEIECTYSGSSWSNGAASRCYFSTTMSQPGCSGALPGVGYPLCTDWPTVAGTVGSGGQITFTPGVKVKLPIKKGDTICDPAKKPEALAKYCRDNATAEIRQKVDQLCTNIATETKDKEIQCCVDKTCGGGDTGLDADAAEPVGGGDTVSPGSESGAPCESGDAIDPEVPADEEPAA